MIFYCEQNLHCMIIINAFLMHQIPTVYEAQSAVHDTLQQYTASFNNALHTHCVPHSPPHPHAHTHTHAQTHTHTHTHTISSLSTSLSPPWIFTS